MQSIRYRLPQTVYTDVFWETLDTHMTGQKTLILSANRDHERWLRTNLPQDTRGIHTIATLQGYLLKTITSVAPRRVVTSYERIMLVGRAWQAAGGSLYATYGQNRGADREMADILSYLSSQRTRWSAAHELDASHELGRIYNTYQTLMDELQLYAYDDLALHVNDLAEIHVKESFLCALELQNASAAQLTALRRVMGSVASGIVGAWVPSGTPEPNPIPEQAVVERFLAEHPTLAIQESMGTASAHLIERLANKTTATPPVRLFAMPGTTATRRVGVLTTTDELQLAAARVRAALAAGSSVSVVCADTALLGPLEATLRDQGIPLPVLSPPHQSNPLIRACAGLIRIREEADESRKTALVHELVTLFQQLDRAAPQANVQDATATQLGTAIEAHARQLTLRNARSTQLQAAVKELGFLEKVWASQSHTPGHVRDFWLREWQQWLAQVDAVGDVLGGDEARLSDIILHIDATPQPTRILQQNDTRLTITGPRGAPHEAGEVIVIGLHEGVAPRRPRGFQLIQEHDIAAALREPPAALPARTDRPATRERERRRVALMVASSAQAVTLGFAYHGLNGQNMLPMAYFDAWGAGSLTFDQYGKVDIDTDLPSALSLVTATSLPTPYTTKTEQTERVQVVHDNHFSNAQIRSYLACPRKYFYEKVARVALPEEEADEAQFAVGNLLHEVLCAAMGTGALQDVDLREESFELFAQRWAGMSERAYRILDHALAGTPCDLGNGQFYTPKISYRAALGGGLLAILAEKEARAMIARWIVAENTHLKPGLTRRPFLLEHPFSFHIDGIEIVGRIDRVDVVKTAAGLIYEIIDYKTTSAKPLSGNTILKEFAPNQGAEASETEENDEKNLPTNYQTLIYLYANRTDAPSKFPPPARMHYVFLNQADTKKGLNINLYRRIDVHPTDTAAVTYGNSTTKMLNVTADLLKTTAETTMRDTMIDMRHTPYPIQPGKACTYCPFITICDATIDDQPFEGEDR